MRKNKLLSSVGTLYKRKMERLASVYNSVFQKHGVTTKEEFERLIRKHFRHSEIRSLHDDIVDNEEEWDTLLRELDKLIASETDKVLKVGDKAPVDMELTDARTGQATSIGKLLSEGKHLVLILLRHFA